MSVSSFELEAYKIESPKPIEDTPAIHPMSKADLQREKHRRNDSSSSSDSSSDWKNSSNSSEVRSSSDSAFSLEWKRRGK